ncbi:AEC family transporter [Terrimonas ferruginea]|uniref:AEC family transporter n=1 Tax=Terrimonas ferruginea TaxID=249 RepID=UPI000422B006|nr:AEC family transporter [Terrimonas ferruginea]
MAAFILIGICILAGFLFRRSGLLPEGSHKSINVWIIYLALPAVSFKYLPHIRWSPELIFPAVSPLIIWLAGWLWVKVYASQRRLPKPAEGGLKLTAGLANTSFVGFPLVTAWFGEHELGTAIICDQVTFILLSTAGIIVAMNSSESHTLQPKVLVQKLIRFPPLIGCIAALILPHFFNLQPLDPLFNTLAATVGPLALFSIGLQLNFQGWREEVHPIAFTLLYKLIAAPLILLLIAFFLQMKGVIAQVTVFEAAMPTLLSSGIIADQYNLHPRLASLVIGIGILLAFITTAGWFWVIQQVLT